MDIVAHGLWTGAGLVFARRHSAIATHTACATVAAAVVPDLVHALPLLTWALFEGHDAMALLHAYAVAAPGQEPSLPPWVMAASHHLHCVAHSAVVALVVTLACVWALRAVPIALYGWWSHIVIDVFTHSTEFYPAPVLYPLSDWTFNGVAWNAPAALLMNYLALAAAWAWLLRQRAAS